MQRDKLVEENIVAILRQRAIDCAQYEGYGAEHVDPETKCGELKVRHITWHTLCFSKLCFALFQRDYDKAAASLYVKYGDLRLPARAEDVLMKQKHRLIWERRHGPIPTSEGLSLD